MSGDIRVAIVGGGIAGLAAAHRLGELGLEGPYVLLERAPRLGGKIATERAGKYVIEGGPDCFLASKPAGVALCRTLGIENRLRGTDPRFRRSYVKRNGRLYELPAGITGLVPSRIRPLLTTRLLTLRGRMRAGLEMFVRSRADGADESIAGFVTRRFGVEAYRWLVEPLLSGIYAGDGEQLSLRATFPQLIELERRQGSVIRMMLKARVGRARPAGSGKAQLGFVTPVTGLDEIVEAIERTIPAPAIRRGVAVERLWQDGGAYVMRLDDGVELRAESVILATPSFITADLVAGFDDGLAAALREIPFVSTATVSVAFPAAAIARPLDGYGYVSPRAEGGPVVACTWTSNKFPDRVPQDGVLIRFFVGRAGAEEVVRASDDEIKRLIRAELERVLGISAEPVLWRIFRWPKGMPQYTLGHHDRLARIEDATGRHEGLFLAGASYRGIGIPDCIDSGRAAAAQAVGYVSGVAA